MKNEKNKIDFLRLLALLILVLGIIYFHINIFLPSKIPFLFKLGVIDHPLNILVLGTDITFIAETGKADLTVNGRSDSILLIHYDPAKSKASIVSIPRDSYVNIPGYGYNKINASFALGGTKLTKETVEKMTNAKIDKFILINTKGIIKLVDILGGIWVDVEKDLYYTDKAQNLYINLKKGYQKLSGEEVNEYIRFRHDAIGDIGRIQRQQNFLRALAKQIMNPISTIKAPFIIEVIRNNVKSDLSLQEFILLINSFRTIPYENISTHMIHGEPANNWAGSVLMLKQEEINKIIQENFK
ncbi:hypothetical protein A2526_01885 [candidate division WOR-1 bacterium RIFOXYD2_FULL_36_8]|uniref:Cell envelope-related transcriptional attenuator domain-containing protein n=1 Tax=candidate division WOR-1 bacterium RIFOXYB2_FULL_36_35 TaxID=1802578 RepID=A0A1F4RX59_UNCSA|nr:MAG: hypothetical protein A2230_07250 [candidate division WOR-1 bacterium RIFOXYA2_FULL_36_21]OGC12762.1 MAG: hypothetical protein A2290_01080 [candidate division WOR-1 bacterium RIFOXYB2_FULL_36_35]OGC19797.1 MAG: hypothetical protein A2282_01000 [candidate division WOR-1 bacterium RIFOXYA12_FULL_36_13]OGC38731.1 MAG: hypothetical protein A2526_01885 [candidate division WOR-1 bacterium RIFOXYD2_FULL_36_8]